ncbi:MAG: glycoside hydrolase family 3 C-terminal domain-containing protein [Clostridia bacterium]|nr:glycoside hydrolase family 3 C-terminal domain-containing protein [Clostridia bacterium]
MLKHQEIINQLTIEQKLSLLADISALGGMSFETGVYLSETSVKEMNAASVQSESYPSFSGLINSWNLDLVSQVSDRLMARARRNGYTIFDIPNANVKATPYTSGYTEDPLLAGMMSGAFVTSGARMGMKTCVSDPTLTQTDADYSDVAPNMRAIKEYFAKPFDMLVKRGVGAMQTSDKTLDGAYEAVNSSLLADFGSKVPLVYECKSPSDTLQFARSSDKLCKKGSVATLKAALDKYNFLQEQFEAGEITINEVEAECRDGLAISPEKIDETLDFILRFADECKQAQSRPMPGFKTAEDSLALRAAEESIVLLKNEQNTLPLRGGNVALIGSLAEANNGRIVNLHRQLGSTPNRFQIIGYAKGYDIEQDRSDHLIQQACDLARRADVVLLVLGYTEEGAQRANRNQTSKLPANQLALVEALSRLNKKIVAIIGGNRYVDVKFDKACSAVLLAPLDGSRSAMALQRIISGDACPSGKLAFTCYNNADEHFQELLSYKNAGRNKVGTFYGYRHYDTSRLRVKYPFGHGLSYTKFEYSNASCSASGIQVTVRNTGSYAGSEVVQIYIGKRDSALIRPTKELKAFFKVYLAAGQSTTISISPKQMDLAVWDEKRARFVTENGTYQVYIGSSVRDIRQTGVMYYGTDKLEKTKERYSDYLQNRSNILDKKYYLDVPMKMPLDVKGKSRRFFIVASIVMLCLDIVYGYFNYVRWAPKTWWMYLTVAALNILPITIATVLTVKRKKEIKECLENNMSEKQKNREKLNVEDLADEIPYEQLFEEEFTKVYEVEQEVAQTVETEEKTFTTVPFDPEFTLPVVCKQFITFAFERGVAVDAATARMVFSALSSSRLLILRSDDSEMLMKFIPLLSEYFGTEFAVDYYGENTDGNALFERKDGYGNVELSAIARKLTSATPADESLHTAVLMGVRCEDIKSTFAPVIRYIDQPERETEVFIKGAANGSCVLPENVWFIVTLADGEKFTDIPKYILDMASLVDLSLKSGDARTRLVAEKTGEEESGEMRIVEQEIERERTSFQSLAYSQFAKLSRNALRDYQIDEVLWKRVDKTEEYVQNACGDYRIENKQWHRLEKYVATYLAAGGEEEEALDCAMAQRLIPAMAVSLATAKKAPEEKFAHTLENVFGEGHVNRSVKVVKSTDLNV